MKQRMIFPWLGCAALVFCLLSQSVILAQEESVAASVATAPLLFTGILNDGNASEGNQLSFTVTINAGDRITATALCEIANDGLRNVDPALTVYAPESEDSLERLQWYNDDSDAVIDCVNYRSSRLSFEAPVTGDYEFIIENLAGRSGPFSLEIQGSSAIQTRLDLAPEGGVEGALTDSSTSEFDDSTALDAERSDATGAGDGSVVEELVFSGLLAAKEDAESASRSYEIHLNAGDEVVAELTCEEDFGSRWLDPSLTVAYTNEAGEESSWHNDDHANLPECLFYRSAGVEFTAPETAIYTFSAHNLSFYKGRYRLLIRGGTAPQTQTTTLDPLWDGTGDPPGSLELFEGNLAYKGEETHTLSLNEGERVAALATCEVVEQLRPVDPLLRILDPAGALVLQVDDSLGFTACASWYSAYGEFTATTSGDYTFVVRNVARDESSGPYTLALVRATPSALASAAIQEGTGGEAIATTRGDVHIGTLGEIGSIFLVETETGQRLDVYAVDSASNGLHVFSIYEDQLGLAAGREELLLASAREGAYSAHLLGDGSLRLSAGPNVEGKRYHMILSGISGEIISTYDEIVAGDAAAASAAALAASPVLALHVVQAGETLYSIGVRYGVGYEAIADANNIGPDFIIHVGAELVIPKP